MWPYSECLLPNPIQLFSGSLKMSSLPSSVPPKGCPDKRLLLPYQHCSPKLILPAPLQVRTLRISVSLLGFFMVMCYTVPLSTVSGGQEKPFRPATDLPTALLQGAARQSLKTLLVSSSQQVFNNMNELNQACSNE